MTLKKFALVLLAVALRTALLGQDARPILQDAGLIKETVEFIMSTYDVAENGNPVHHEESHLIDSVFKAVLLDYFGIKKPSNDFSVEYLFNLLYRNGTSEYEDSPDVLRVKTRKSLCFAAIALKADRDDFDLRSSGTFFEYAEYAILDKCPNEVEDLLESTYCGLLFLELLVTAYDEYDCEVALGRIEDFISEEKGSLGKQTIDKATALINRFRQIKN